MRINNSPSGGLCTVSIVWLGFGAERLAIEILYSCCSRFHGGETYYDPEAQKATQ